ALPRGPREAARLGWLLRRHGAAALRLARAPWSLRDLGPTRASHRSRGAVFLPGHQPGVAGLGALLPDVPFRAFRGGIQLQRVAHPALVARAGGRGHRSDARQGASISSCALDRTWRLDIEHAGAPHSCPRPEPAGQLARTRVGTAALGGRAAVDATGSSGFSPADVPSDPLNPRRLRRVRGETSFERDALLLGRDRLLTDPAITTAVSHGLGLVWRYGRLIVFDVLAHRDHEHGRAALPADDDRPRQEHHPHAEPLLPVFFDDRGFVLLPVLVPLVNRHRVVHAAIFDPVDLEACALCL